MRYCLMKNTSADMPIQKGFVMATERKNVPFGTQRLLWGVAAGRCEFKGCNKPLYKHDVTGITENLAEQAHIYAVKQL